jgi:hypothetical protein
MRDKEPVTLQAKFGFQDGDLKTPKHDEIMIWLADNILEICMRILGVQSGTGEWPSAEIDKTQAEILALEKDGYRREGGDSTEIPKYPGTFRVSVVWEKPIMSDKYTVGFVDLQALCRHKPHLSINKGGGYWDKTYSYSRYWEQETTINFEVKSSIPSLGELIRQISFYKQYSESGTRFVVVSPDTRWQRQLESQGIGFVNSDAPL